MQKPLTGALETVKALKKRAEDRIDEIMKEMYALEEYGKRLDPVIEAIESLPELGEILLSKIQPPPGTIPKHQGKKMFTDEEVDEQILYWIRNVSKAATSVNEIAMKNSLSWDRVNRRMQFLCKQGHVIPSKDKWLAVKIKE